ncbi:MAG: hypothetical protein EHM67_06465 [Hyphomicrobiaceae bacterium]|nr:MAG: hypothetical protein EHM67_06465 [Hyphomicrobiaceae bacterium]
MQRNHKVTQQQWLAAYEAALVAAVPALAGKVDWDTANYFYYRGGDTPQGAAAHMAQRWADHDTD